MDRNVPLLLFHLFVYFKSSWLTLNHQENNRSGPEDWYESDAMWEGNSNAAAERQQDVLKENMRSADTDISEVCDYIVPDQRSSLNFILLFLFVWGFCFFFWFSLQ